MKTHFYFLIILNANIYLSFAQNKYINPNGNNIYQRFVLPKGFTRGKTDTSSFTNYLRNLPLKPNGAIVKTYDGRIKPNRSVYCGVVDMEIGKENLQQCADAIIRLRAEYLFKQKNYSKIHFNLTNGFKADYLKWQEGYRVEVTGNKTKWIKKAAPSSDYKTFRNYLNFVFIYAGTLSLSKELQQVKYSCMQIGDVFIQGGSPGHAVIVVDMAENPQTKEKIYLLAQSYMPAQEIQVLLNPTDPDLSPWYKLNNSATETPTPEWHFKNTDIKRFTKM